MQVSFTGFRPFIFSAQLSFALLVSMGACSSKNGNNTHAPSSWPKDNPFALAESISVTSAKEKHPSQFRIFFSGNVNGETEPCGCAVNPKGGLDRRWNYIQQGVKESPFPYLIVDAGNALFASEKLDKSQASLQKQRAALIVKGHSLMKVVAQNVGYLDLSAGVDFLKTHAEKEGLTLLSANWVNSKGELLFRPTMNFDLGREKALLVGLSRGFKTDDGDAQGPKVLDPFQTLEKILASVAEDQLVIILSDLGVDQDRTLAAKFARPLTIIGSRDLSSLEVPIHEAKSILLQGQLQGQQWGVLDVAWKARARGWYNVKLGVQFKDLWERRAGEWQVAASRENTPERSAELDLLIEAREDMLRYQPTKLEQKNIYEYKLVDMNVEYSKPNELTPLMLTVKKPK